MGADTGTKRGRVNNHTFPGAEYVSRAGKAYTIVVESGLWRIKPYRASGFPQSFVQTSYTNFKDAENALIQYLKSTDRPWKRATYPGCPEPKPTKSTEPS